MIIACSPACSIAIVHLAVRSMLSTQKLCVKNLNRRNLRAYEVKREHCALFSDTGCSRKRELVRGYNVDVFLHGVIKQMKATRIVRVRGFYSSLDNVFSRRNMLA